MFKSDYPNVHGCVIVWLIPITAISLISFVIGLGCKVVSLGHPPRVEIEAQCHTMTVYGLIGLIACVLIFVINALLKRANK